MKRNMRGFCLVVRRTVKKASKRFSPDALQLLKIAAPANNTVETMNSPEIKPTMPVMNNSPIMISLYNYRFTPLLAVNRLINIEH